MVKACTFLSETLRVSESKWVQSTELDVVNGSLCNLHALALGLALHIFAIVTKG